MPGRSRRARCAAPIALPSTISCCASRRTLATRPATAPNCGPQRAAECGNEELATEDTEDTEKATNEQVGKGGPQPAAGSPSPSLLLSSLCPLCPLWLT